MNPWFDWVPRPELIYSVALGGNGPLAANAVFISTVLSIVSLSVIAALPLQ